MYGAAPLITIAIPSLNQGCYLEQALSSVFAQNLNVEVFVLDGGSTDNSLAVIQRWQHRLAGWRSHTDQGQAAAINEGIALGSAPYVCWLNSDDWLLPNSLNKLLTALQNHPQAPAAYGRAWHVNQNTGTRKPVWVEPFNSRRLAWRCIICQPASLIRRSAWQSLHGLDPSLNLAMDYDLWWRLYKQFGQLLFIDQYIAVNRVHDQTKTHNQRFRHYQEAIAVVRKHYGRVPWKWWLAQPYAVWWKSLNK
ncbi:glycosyltransferase [Methylomonas paludis]|uniref:Glycosyltransferase n=1 Tax=Methylomonas paludis TaxID=1173101 RepID=A0A975R9A0_9GAMM|nr:glycosyltransferase family 2 protein [Methylomonas paludis]QWF70862.1 glycosyltransferase [Methylomonas paludis]